MHEIEWCQYRVINVYNCFAHNEVVVLYSISSYISIALSITLLLLRLRFCVLHHLHPLSQVECTFKKKKKVSALICDSTAFEIGGSL